MILTCKNYCILLLLDIEFPSIINSIDEWKIMEELKIEMNYKCKLKNLTLFE